MVVGVFMRIVLTGIIVGVMFGAHALPVRAEMKKVKSKVERIWVYPKAKGNRIDVQFAEKTGCGETGKPEPAGNSVWLKYERPETKYMMGALLYAKHDNENVQFWFDTDACEIKNLSPLE